MELGDRAAYEAGSSTYHRAIKPVFLPQSTAAPTLAALSQTSAHYLYGKYSSMFDAIPPSPSSPLPSSSHPDSPAFTNPWAQTDYSYDDDDEFATSRTALLRHTHISPLDNSYGDEDVDISQWLCDEDDIA